MAYGPDTDILLREISKCKQESSEILKSEYLYIYWMNITSLPVLSKYIKGIICTGSRIQELPELHEGLEYLNVNQTQIEQLPTLPKSLKFLSCSFMKSQFKLPTLPEGLEQFLCGGYLLENSFSISNKEWNPDMFPLLPKSLNTLVCYIQAEKDETMETYIERVRDWQERSSKQRIQERCRIIKEDLMKAAWHPRRVEKWMEAGALDSM
jgi:hypothetical protein